jgi:hypothetical protein
MSSIRVDYDILNQKQTPAFYASSLATRPAFGFPGRIFIDTDTPSSGIYRDTGSAWIQVADPGAGTTGTLQQVTTNGSSTTVGLSTSGNGIGIGTTIPASNKLDIHSASGINATFNGTTTNDAALQLQNAGTGKWNIQNLYNAGANSFQVYDVLNSTARLTILNTGAATFNGNVTTGSQLSILGTNTGGKQLFFTGGITKFNFMVAAQQNVDNGFEITPSTGVGGSTFTTPVFKILNTGVATFISSATATAFIPSGATIPTNGMYLSAANTLNFATASTNRLTIASTGDASFSSSVTAGGFIATNSVTVTSPIDTLTTKAYFSAASISGAALTLVADSLGRTLRISSNTSGTVTGSFDANSSGVNIGSNTAHSLIFNTSGVSRLTIASTGAATFSSTIAATSATLSGDLTLTSTGGHTINMVATTGGSQTISMTALGGGSNTITGTGGDFNIQTTGAYPLVFKTNSAERYRITSAGINNYTSRGNYLGATDNALFSLNSGGTLYTVGFSPNATANSNNTLTLTTAQTTWIYTGTGLATWTLPTPSGTNQMFWIKNAGTGIITLNAFSGTNIIDNSATSVSSITIAVGATVLIQQDGNVKSYQLQ